jgi:hypothetical protein
MKLPSYAVYITYSDQERESLYRQYCKKTKLDPELESSIYDFFDSMDNRDQDTSLDHLDQPIEDIS